MIKQENPNFIASKYAPNPKEVSYWIDLATDSTGNVIKSYSPDLKKWTPLNRDANVDQWTHIKEIVQSVGLNYDKNVEYATLNSQKAFNANLTAEGYHQGGLGEGVTTSSVTVNGTTTYSFVPCGTTNSLGNGTGIIEYTHTNTNVEGASTGTKTVNVPRYRGIENPFGHVWKNVTDVVVAGTDNSVYICKDYTKFGTFEGGTNPTAEQLIAAGYELQDFKESTITSQYVKKLVNNNQADLFPAIVGNGVSATTYYCDYHWTNATATPRTFLIGGCSDNGSAAGLFALSSGDGFGASGGVVGTRITFYGEPALPAAPATLELNDEDYEQLDSIESEENWF